MEKLTQWVLLGFEFFGLNPHVLKKPKLVGFPEFQVIRMSTA